MFLLQFAWVIAAEDCMLENTSSYASVWKSLISEKECFTLA